MLYNFLFFSAGLRYEIRVKDQKKMIKGIYWLQIHSDFRIISILPPNKVAKNCFIFNFVPPFSGCWLLLKMPFLISRELLASSGIHAASFITNREDHLCPQVGKTLLHQTLNKLLVFSKYSGHRNDLDMSPSTAKLSHPRYSQIFVFLSDSRLFLKILIVYKS